MGFPNPVSAYTKWLHTMWPAGPTEKLPRVREDGTCGVAGVYIVGDLTGIPLLKFSLHSGARAVKRIVSDAGFQRLRQDTNPQEGIYDLVIIGGGVAGLAAAVEAKKAGLRFVVLEASQPFNTIASFPVRKPIYTYPTSMDPDGTLKVTASVKEELLEELLGQIREHGIETTEGRAERIHRAGNALHVALENGESVSALRVIVAIGRSGDYRNLGVVGEDLSKVTNRLHDPMDFAGKDALVIGGGDSALETAISLVQCGARVTLIYRKPEFSRPKPENLEAIVKLATEADTALEKRETWMPTGEGPGTLRLIMSGHVREIREHDVVIEREGKSETISNDAVFAMIGRKMPLDFFRRSGIRISGEGTPVGWAAFAAFLIFCVLMYAWKTPAPFTNGWTGAFPANVPGLLGNWFQEQVNDKTTLLGTLAVSMSSRSFYYTFLYSLAVTTFGIARIMRRKTPYITVQTVTLILIQVIPLFILPEIILPWMGYNGWFTEGMGRAIGDNLFEMYIPAEEYVAGIWPEGFHPRAYWRAYGFILAWPLMVYNVFTSSPMWWWLAIGFIQTFVFIPVIIYFWGKGAYCGWICTCGALAETVGDQQRHKMPHGPFWNRLNMAGQFILLLAFIGLAMRIYGWVFPGSWADRAFAHWFSGYGADGTNYLSYHWFVDVFLAGVIGVGLYFKYSGRVWCRFFCPLAALMHVYTRFSRFRILSEKKKCISCNICTSVCHQGIDVMSFANKGIPMKDPQCVRCSACVFSCPTGVLSFGQVDRDGNTIKTNRMGASPVIMEEEKAGHGGRR